MTVTLYGLSRFFDEYLFLSHGTPGDVGVEVISLVFVGVGLLFAVFLVLRARPLAAPSASRARELPVRGGPGDPWAAPPSVEEGAAASNGASNGAGAPLAAAAETPAPTAAESG
jgi:hypothetical protein